MLREDLIPCWELPTDTACPPPSNRLDLIHSIPTCRTSEAAAIGFAAEHRLNIVEAVNGLAQQTNVLSIFPGPETLKNYKAKSEEEIFGSESPSSAAQHEVDHSEQTRESQVVQILQQLGKHMIHAGACLATDSHYRCTLKQCIPTCQCIISLWHLRV